MSMDADPTVGRAFGEGSDARIAGQRIGTNPYPKADARLYSYWKRGWLDVDEHWGKEAKGWVKAIPEIDYYTTEVGDGVESG